MYKLPNFFTQQITNTARLTKQDLKDLGINPDDVKKSAKTRRPTVKKPKVKKEKSTDDNK